MTRDDGHDAELARGEDREHLLAHLPGLLRLAGMTWWRTTLWGATTTVRLGRRVAEAAGDPDRARELARELGVATRVVTDLGRAVSAGVPLPRALADLGTDLGLDPDDPPGGVGRPAGSHGAQLRRRGEELLERSRDVWDDDATHPAYERILGELAPDEARILLLLRHEGPQPSVDVRTGGPVGMVSSRLVAPGLSMVGARAGCRHVDQVPASLNNVVRLGLVWLSQEALRDPLEYQVVEAQPDVLEALASTTFAKVVRRSIQLTPFGADFCAACFGDDGPSGWAGTGAPPGRPPGSGAP